MAIHRFTEMKRSLSTMYKKGEKERNERYIKKGCFIYYGTYIKANKKYMCKVMFITNIYVLYIYIYIFIYIYID